MAFRLDKLTVKSQEAVQRAQSLAAEKGHPEIDPLHLLAALLDEEDGVARPILEKVGVSVAQLQRSGRQASSAASRRSAAAHSRWPVANSWPFSTPRSRRRRP